MSKRGNNASVSITDKDLRGFLRLIEIDEATIEGLRRLAGERRDWFFRAAAGSLRALSNDERGRAAFIFGRLLSSKDLGRLAKLAVAKSPLVRSHAIAALGRLKGRPATDVLMKLLTDPRRPVIDRLQVARILSTGIDDRDLERLQKFNLKSEPNELQYGVEVLLEKHRLRRRYSDTPF